MVDEIIQTTFEQKHHVDALEVALVVEEIDEDDSEIVECVNMLNVAPKSLKSQKQMELLELPTDMGHLANPSIEEPPILELKQSPPHLKYVYLGESSTLPVNISSSLSAEQEGKLLRILREYKRALGWTIADIKGIYPSISMHKIKLEECHMPTIEHQRRLNPIMKEVVKKEILKWLDAGIIYPISDSPWVSPVQFVPKKGSMTIVANTYDELIPTRTINGWRVCIDYRKLNKATRKDHFPLPFIDQMLDRLVGKEHFYFLNVYFG